MIDRIPCGINRAFSALDCKRQASCGDALCNGPGSAPGLNFGHFLPVSRSEATMVVVCVGLRTAPKHAIGRCHNEHSALMASARVTVHDSRHPILLARVALRRSADCPVCCVAGCQPATAPVLKRHPLATVHRADWQSAKQQTRLSALRRTGRTLSLLQRRPSNHERSTATRNPTG